MIFDILKDATEYTNSNKKSIIILSILYIISIMIPVYTTYKLFISGIMLSIPILICLFCIFIIPLLLIEGYSYHIIKESLKGTINISEKIPPIKLNLKFLINGIKLLIVNFIYFLPAIIALMCELPLYETLTFQLFLIDLMLLLIGIFLCNISSVNMIKNNSIIKAFDFKEIFLIIKEIGLSIYFKLFIAILIVMIGSYMFLIFIVALITLIFTYGFPIEFSTITKILISIVLFILLAIYTIFKDRAIASIYNLK